MDINNVLLYSTSSAAQVWAAILVFHVLLVRDRKASIEKEVEELFSQTRYWWVPLIQKLRDKNAGGLGSQLDQIGLTDEIVDAAESDQKSFKCVMKETYERQIITTHQISALLNMGTRKLTPDAYQRTLDPISKRLKVLDSVQMNIKAPFFLGMIAIFSNLLILMSLTFITISPACLLWGIGGINMLFLGLFTWQICPALNSD